MAHKIVLSDDTEFSITTIPEQSIHVVSPDREWIKLVLGGTTIEDVKENFIDNLSYKRKWDSRRYLTEQEAQSYDSVDVLYYMDEHDNPYVNEVYEEDLSDHCIAGDVVDNRNGNIIVYMGKKTEHELSQETIDNLMLLLLGGE